MLDLLSGRSGAHQAGFWFTLQTLLRSSRHRTVLATSFAIGATLLVLALRGVALTAHLDVTSVSTRMLASEMLLIGTVLVGIRRAADLSADARATVTFDVAWLGDWRQYLSGVTRAAWVVAALPIAAAFLLWHAIVVGPLWATQHAVIICLWAGIGLSLLLRKAPPLVFGCADDRNATVARSAGRFGILVIAALLFASLEHYAIALGRQWLVLVAVLTVTTGWAVRPPRNLRSSVSRNGGHCRRDVIQLLIQLLCYPPSPYRGRG
jgi:hypothetical protein